MNLQETKMLTMLLLGGISFIIGLITWKLSTLLGMRNRRAGRKEKVVTSLLLCFGGGVLFATCLLHILPEAREGFEGEEERLEINWLAELSLSAGFFLVYFVEEIVHTILSRTDHTEQIHRTFSTRKSGADHQSSQGIQGNQGNIDQPDANPEGCCDNANECHNDMELGSVDEANNTKYNPKYEVRLSISTNSMFPNYHAPETVDAKSPVSTRKEKKKPVVKVHTHTVKQTDNLMKDMITVLALSFHAIFEGLAVGLEMDLHDVWTLFAAISAHKFVITFTVSLELLQSGTKTMFYFVYLTTFSLVSPLGIGIGILISETGEQTDTHLIVVSILQGVAGGTIIYIVMFEVLQREKTKEVSGLLQLVAIIVGFSVMLAIEVIGRHSHEHAHHHGGDEVHADRIMFPDLINSTQFVSLEDSNHDDPQHQHQDPVHTGYSLVGDSS